MKDKDIKELNERLAEIQSMLDSKGSLLVGVDISYITAWELYPRLRINSSRTCDYIDDILPYENPRPVMGGIWAEPPTFTFADPDYIKEWNDYIKFMHSQQKLLSWSKWA